MSTKHGGSPTPVVNGSTEENVTATSNTIRSLSELARKKTSFKWSRTLPTFMATSSRGSIPHLTPDKIDQHSNIRSVHIGLEDFIASPVQDSPILSIETTLQRYLAYPESTSLVLSARRANPVPINSSWDDRIEIITIDGHKPFPVEAFINAVHRLRLRESDIAISVPDVTETPGVKRLTKMVQRTQRWLNLLLESDPECKIYASIPPIPPSRAPALLDDYMDFLAENAGRLAGLAIYNIFPDHPITQFLPDEIAALPILLVPSPLTPHEILAGILSDEVNVFTAGGMITSMSDLGIALDFSLHTTVGGNKIPLGRDMFAMENAADITPLVSGCQCFTCKNHHRAYVHHLLKCHEMTAWVLLQIHNFHILDLFFKEIHVAIKNGTLPAAAERFDTIYSTEQIMEAASRGPRVRGHHTSLRREQKKRKLPVAKNTGLVGKDASVFSGGEVIERDGKRKHWRQFPGVDGITEDGMDIFDEEDHAEGELLPKGEIEIVREEAVVENGR